MGPTKEPMLLAPNPTQLNLNRNFAMPIPVPPASAFGGTARAIGHPDPFSNMSIAVLAFFLFVVTSRLPEVMGNVVGTSLKVSAISLTFSLTMMFLSGRLSLVLARPAALWALAFTFWGVLCIPFSVWKGGAFTVFKDNWFFSLAVFFVVASLPNTVKQLVTCASAMCWATILIIGVLLNYGTVSDSRGSLEFASSLSNPNIMALQLLLGIPFLVHWGKSKSYGTRRWLGSIIAVSAAALIVLRTGSRSGLIALFVVSVFFLLSMKLATRVLLAFLLIIGSLIMVPFIPDYLWNRYTTIFRSDSDASDTSEAAESSRARKQHLKESLILTIQKPLFGVGPGQFQVGSADLAKEENRRALWRETHNTFTQISSETGIPGFIFYMLMIATSLLPVWKNVRQAKKRGETTQLQEIGRALSLSALGLMINSNFCSLGYQYYWPVMCGLGVAYQRVALNESIAAAARRR